MENIWIIGAGSIAIEYAKVLNSLKCDYKVIGRGEESAKLFEQVIGKSVIRGGLANYLLTLPTLPQYVIVAVDVTGLKDTAIMLMNYGVKCVLLEKPGFCQPEELDDVIRITSETSSKVYLAYNRRFYSSVLSAEKIVKEDGGIKSFSFEFTEWGHVIEKLNHNSMALKNWFYANSTHVVDLAFFFGGIPKQLASYTAGELTWHKPAIFAGAGITEKDALFSYQANWNAPGRWAVELLTDKHRLYLKPMEALQIQEKGSVAIELVQVDNHLDVEFKPGFYLQTKAFIEGDYSRFCTIEEQQRRINSIYKLIVGHE